MSHNEISVLVVSNGAVLMLDFLSELAGNKVESSIQNEKLSRFPSYSQAQGFVIETKWSAQYAYYL